ncbi:hypothetical protein QP027_07760 [Corynebacterium breve]|uniref:Uncharacterized protein n=1 Tax=Corynebacterium breve TaxID=3049799 RepID=A0ABY8VD29_9CORY|nr:hypothetical protein [Corynebacterium breve]WIM67022.1 hypothetical protein QP027_07760 [Corynebacterium breve]
MSTSLNARTPRRIPAAAFVLGYGVLAIAAVVLIVLLVSHEAEADDPIKPGALPPPPGPPPGTEVTHAESQVQPWLIDDATFVRTNSGMTLTGELTEAAMSDTEALANNMDHMLSQNCLDNIGLQAPDNLQVDVWGFCYSSMRPDLISGYIDQAVEDKADSMTMLSYPLENHQKQVFFTWFADSAEEQEEIEKLWDDYKRDPDIYLVSLTVYGPDVVIVSDLRKGEERSRLAAPTNKVLQDIYGR